MTVKATYSPAEALQKKLMKKPCSEFNPAFLAAMPKEKPTAKYPNMMGMASTNPV